MTIIGGTETLVNSTTTEFQGNAVVTGLEDGGWVVAWQSYGQDGSDGGVYQQRYDASGVKLGGETLVNSNTYLDQAAPSIASLEGGGWVVVWQSYWQGNDSEWGVYQQAYDAAGNKLGSEQRVPSYSGYSEGNPSVAGLPGGGWVVAWAYAGHSTSQSYDASGNVTGPAGWTMSSGAGPVIAALPDGSTLIVQEGGVDYNGTGIWQLVFTPSGSMWDSVPWVANTQIQGDQKSPAVTILPDGGWIIVWKTVTSDGNGNDIHLQRFDSSGGKVAGEVLVNSNRAGDQSEPSVAALADGGWVVVWQGVGVGDDVGIFQQLFDWSGQPIDSEYLVNSVTTGDQLAPVVTALTDGSWVVTWGGAGADDSDGVHQRVFTKGDIDAVGYDGAATVEQDSSYVFSRFDFQHDVDPNSSIVITSLPSAGTLLLDGASVAEGETVTMADIRAGLLTWSLAGGDPASGPSISFVVLDDGETLSGGEVPNVLTLNFAPELANPLSNQVAIEDQSFSFTVPADTFVDIDGGTLSYSATLADGDSLPYWLTFNASTRTFSGTPSDYYVGTVSVKVIATDADGGSVGTTFDLEVQNTYDAPSSYYYNSISNMMYQDQSYYGYITHYFKADQDHAITSYSIKFADGSTPSWAAISSEGILTFSPDNSAVGLNAFTISAQDDTGATGTVTYNLTVVNANDPPTVANAIPNQMATEDSAFSFQFASNAFNDIDVGDSLTYSATLDDGTALPTWLSFNAATRTFSGTPLNDNVGTTAVKVTARDTSSAFVSDTFHIVVANTNDAPVVANAIANQNATEDAPFNFQFAANVFSDVDVSNTLTYAAQIAGGGALPSWLAFNTFTRTFSGTPTNGDVGTITIEVIADDGFGGTVTEIFNIVIANTNDAPTITNAIADQGATEDTAFSFQFASNTFNDIDPGDNPTYTATLPGGSALPSWLSFNPATRTFSGTPANGDTGMIAVQVIADDGNGGTVTEIFNIVIANTNDAPTITNAIADQGATEDTAFSFQFASNAFTDVDAGDTLTYTATLAGGGALPSWLSFDPATRTFSGTPANGDVDTISIVVTADDGNGDTVTETFDISVANTNDAPHVANTISDQGATEDASFSFQFASNTFGDVEADNLTYTATLPGGSALPSWLNFDPATRTFSGTPANGDVGTIAVEVIADDGNGGAVTETFNLSIANTNDAPVLANAIENQSAAEDTAFSFQFAANAFNDIDAGDTLTYTATLAGGGALPSWLSFDPATRTFSGTPANGQAGTIVVEVTADDGNGGAVADAFSIVVANTNYAPVLANAIEDRNATEDTAFSFQFASDTFGDIDLGDTLTYTATLPGGGALPSWLGFDPVTRTFSGTPANSDVGTISIEIVANDGHGGTVTETFNLSVANANDAPVLANAIVSQNATEDTAFSFQFASNVFNDIDIGDNLTYTATLPDGGALPSWLSFDPATRTFSGTPANGDVGTISIEIIANDGHGGTVTETFNLSVANTNDAPVLANAVEDRNATEDTTFSFQFASNTFDDVDADTLAYSAQLSSGGTLPSWLTFDPATRTFSGTPANGDVGTIAIEVIADDGHGATVSETFNLSVANANDAPVIASGITNQTATENAAFSFQFASDAFNDIDLGDTLTYTATLAGGGALPSWLSFDPATRTFSGTPANGDVGTIAIEVIGEDGHGATVSEAFELTIADINTAPTGANRTITINEDSAYRFTVADFGFSDGDGNGLKSIIIDDRPETGTFTLNGKRVLDGQAIDADDFGKLVWKPAKNANGDDLASLTFRLQDDGGTVDGGQDISQSHTLSFDVTEVVDVFDGNKRNNVLRGTDGDDILFGMRGNDKLFGGEGADIFKFRTRDGKDTINDFDAWSEAHDVLDLSKMKSISDFDVLMENHVRVRGDDIVISAPHGDRVILKNVSIENLDAGDFQF